MPHHSNGDPPMAVVAAATALVLVLAACGGTPTTASSSTPTTTPTVTQAPSATPSPTHVAPADAAPAALLGRWTTHLGQGDDATLIIAERRYSMSRGDAPIAGNLSVTGNIATFSGVSSCDKAGSYEWAIAGGILTFTPLAPQDTCPRATVLIGHEFELVHH